MEIFNRFCNWFKGLGRKKYATVSNHRVKNSLKRRQQSRQVEINNTPIHYVLNDMSTPDLRLNINSPVPPEKPPFVVEGFKGGGFTKNQREFPAANAYVTVTNTLTYMMNKTPNKLQSWAINKPLLVIPFAGQNLNAYYDRKHLKFFSVNHHKIGLINTADSSEIVAHELGHAILDAYRPDTWSAASLEVWAFHEAFADFVAMINLLSHRRILQKVINQTKGNLKTPNVASNLAEHVALAIYQLAGPDLYRSKDYLRTTIHDFKYVDPGQLPNKAPDNQLAAESHSFGRVFTGALYDILEMMYLKIYSNGRLNQIDSLGAARDTLTGYLLMAIQNAPLNAKFYESMAKTLLWVDVKLSNRRFHDDMQGIFFERQILQPQLGILSSAPPCDNALGIMSSCSKMNLKLSNHFFRMQSDNPLYDVEVEIPHDQAFLYDNDNNAIYHVSASDHDGLMGAQDMILHLHETNSVSDNEDTPFEICDRKLQRTHFSGGPYVL